VSEGGAPDCIGPFDSILTTPEITAPSSEEVVVEISHRYSFEPDPSAAWDIGQVRVSVNGGEFVTVSGGSFLENGYFSKAVAGAGMMKGLFGFSGQTEGYADGAFITSKAIIGKMAAGDKFKVQFISGHDQCATGAKPNWEIDSVSFVKRPPIAVYDFASSDGGFEVSNIQPIALPGPFEYNADKGTWVSEGGAPDCIGPFDSILTTPEITAPSSEEVVVEISHRYSFEPDPSAAWDIGQVRVSVNGGEFVTVSGGSFLENGYFSKAVAGAGMMKGLFGFSGQTEGYADGAFITSKAIIGKMAAGDKFKVQFISGHDQCATGAKPNWEIDSVSFVKRPPIAVYDFASDDGGFEVSNIQPIALTGPFEYNADKGTWVSEGGSPDCVGPYDSIITTPEITAASTGGVVVELSHRYSFEPDPSAAWDIGQIRVSVNGSEFESLAAGYFIENGYFSKPVAGAGIFKGQIGFSGQTEGYADGAFITSSAFIGAMTAGDKFQVQFVSGHDQCATGAKPNWEIDSVAFVGGESPYVPATVAIVESGPEGFTIEITDTGSSQVEMENVSIKLNGTDVVPVKSKSEGVTTLLYEGDTPLPVADPNYVSITSPPEAVTSLFKVDSNHAITVANLPEAIEGKVVYTDPAVADVPLKNAADVAGNIALCDRGATYFDRKAQYAFEAGAVASIVANNRPGAPIVMGTGRVLFYEQGPHFMISQDDGMKIKPYLDQGVTVSISPGHKIDVSMTDSAGKTIEDSYR
ncbi:uncharacterized protein METZ01_LOCUS100801, partial [marine metagenome]